MAKKTSLEQVRASLNIANPVPAAAPLQSVSAAENKPVSLAANDTLIRLHIDQVIPYKRNPRHAVNERYVEIRESIRERGLDDIVKVTKRPGESIYFPVAGGNTRILALKELYAETRNDRFGFADFIYTEYQGEADILARHFIENELRADLIFWDKAKALVDLKREIEQEIGEVLSTLGFEKALKQRGIVEVGRNIISHCRFAIEKLSDLGSAASRLSRLNVQEHIQPLYLRLRRLAEKFSMDEGQFQLEIVKPVLSSTDAAFIETGEFSVEALCTGLVNSISAKFDLDPTTTRRMLAILDQNPDATKEQLIAPPAPSSASSEPAVVNQQASAGGQSSAAAGANEVENLSLSGSPTRLLNTSSSSAGKSTDILFASNLTPGDHTRRPQENPSGALDLGEAAGGHSANQGEIGSQATVPPGSAPAAASKDAGQADPKAQFLDHLRSFAQEAFLEDALRITDGMPLGFYVDLPTPTEPGVPLDIESQSGGNPHRYVAWWLLARLSGILDADSPANRALPSDSPITIALADDEKWDDEVRNTVGEPLYQDTLGKVLEWMTDPGNRAGGLLLNLLAAVRGVQASNTSEIQGRGQ